MPELTVLTGFPIRQGHLLHEAFPQLLVLDRAVDPGVSVIPPFSAKVYDGARLEIDLRAIPQDFTETASFYTEKKERIVVKSIIQRVQPEREMSVLQSVFLERSPERAIVSVQDGGNRVLRIEAGGFA